MCTMASVSCSHGHYLLKTLDFSHPGVYAGTLRHTAGSKSAIGIGMFAQGGFNAGINEAGVAVMMSYFGTHSGDEHEIGQHWNDVRGIYNARVLFEAKSASDAVERFEHLLQTSRPPVGGAHLVMDREGNLGVVEHANGEIVCALYRNGEVPILAYANTANHGFHSEQQKLPDILREDRETRRAKIQVALEQILHDDKDQRPFATRLRDVLSLHRDSSTEVGSICIHHHDLPGARANLKGAMSTISGIIIDVVNRTITYSDGNPCQGEWESLSFTNKGANQTTS